MRFAGIVHPGKSVPGQLRAFTCGDGFVQLIAVVSADTSELVSKISPEETPRKTGYAVDWEGQVREYMLRDSSRKNPWYTGVAEPCLWSP